MPTTTIHPSAVVEPGAELGEGCTVGPFTLIRANVRLGANSTVGSHCVLGEGNDRPLIIGSEAIIRSHAVIYGGSTFGPRLQTGHHVSMREDLRVGTNLQVGTKCDLQGDATIGDYCRMVFDVHVTRGSTIGNFVWMFAKVLLTNDPHPPADTCMVAPTIEDGALLTSQVTVLPGVRIGFGAFIAAGTIVTRDVEPERIVRGVPGRDVGSLYDITCTHGQLDTVYPWWNHFRRGFPDDVQFPDFEQLRSEHARRS